MNQTAVSRVETAATGKPKPQHPSPFQTCGGKQVSLLTHEANQFGLASLWRPTGTALSPWQTL